MESLPINVEKLFSLFPDDRIEKKIWGLKYSLFKSTYVSVTLNWARKNSFCSLHYHRYKSNYFYILQGELVIEYHTKVYDKEKNTHVTNDNIVVIGENPQLEKTSFTIFPNVRHRFQAAKDSLFIEIDSVHPKSEDIIRLKEGGTGE